MADDGDGFILVIVGFIGGIYLFFKGFKWLKQQRLIENIPTSKIRSLAMGLVEIYGSITPFSDKILKSPFLNVDCVYYKYFIEEERKSKNSRHWAVIRQGESNTPFYLNDETGKVLIDPNGAQINLVQDHQYVSGFNRNPPIHAMNFLTANNMKSTSLFGFNKKMRYREFIIQEKDKLYILGSAGDNPYMKDGSAKHNSEDIMIQKNKHDPIYLITDKDEKQILSSLKWKARLGIFGGALMTIGCLIIILVYLGMF